LPATLLHGAPHSRHWRLTLFGEYYLIDWSEARIGPGVLDLMAFIEGYPLLFDRCPADASLGEPALCPRELTPILEETLIDTYLLTLSTELGSRSTARAYRAALPAARCFHTLLTWFPFFADWATELPIRPGQSPDKWIPAGFRRYLAGAFERFLRAYRGL
jgi:hypothetical protein